MPRPAKGRKKTTGVGAGEAADLLNAISSHGIDERALLRILNVERTPCDHVKSPCKANRKDNIACFCQLVPAETSFRKKGLWQKEQAYLGTLGSDPIEQKREDAANPSGLRNLGNTCYANAALQCLFSIPSLRNGIYAAEAQVSAHDIIRQLQTLFLHMQFGPRSSEDTEALAKTLGLNHAIQQDGQEFLKLLLMRVEQLLSKSNDPAARGLVQQLFRGGLSYVTTCQRCGRGSASSREVQDFYDLMPQVRGFANLTDSLAAILHAEWLTGDNRYRCEFCSEKVDAIRHVRLRSLPPYLCLALQRFYFDPRTADKAKALDKFAFPLQLDFRRVLETAAATAAEEAHPKPLGAGADDATATAAAAAAANLEVPQFAAGSPLYELVGILIHKGSQASSGHYVAHIKDQASGQWWRFDDESAECIGPDPTAKFQSDHGAASASAAGAENGKGSSRKRATGAGGDDPDYDFDQDAKGQTTNADGDDDGAPARAGRGGRGKKRSASSRPRGRPAKRTAAAANGSGGGSRSSRGRQRGGSASFDAYGDGDEDEDFARAVAASLEPQAAVGGGGGGGGPGLRTRNGAAQAEGVGGNGEHEDVELQMALAASKREQHVEDTVMAAVLQESRQAAEVAAGLTEEAAIDAARKAGLEEAAAAPAEEAPIMAAAPPPTPGGALGAEKEQEEPGGRPEEAALAAGEPFGGTIAFEPGAIWSVAIKASPQPKATPQGRQLQCTSPPAADGAGGSSQGVVVSANAYMLVYRAVGFDEPPAVAEVAALPGGLQEAVAGDAAAFVERCEVYQRQRQAMKDQMEGRRRAIRELLAIINPSPSPSSAKQREQQHTVDLTDGEAPANGQSCPSSDAADIAADVTGAEADLEAHCVSAGVCGPSGFWVSTAWLERWANDEAEPPPIDNSPIICTKHGPSSAAGAGAGSGAGEAEGGSNARPAALDPSKATAAKLVSPEAWKRLHEAHKGGPAIAACDVCLGCLASNFNDTLLVSQADGVRARVATLLEEAARVDAAQEAQDVLSDGEEIGDEDEAGAPGAAANRQFWVSKQWLQGWSRRQGMSIKAEKSPTADVVCPHGQLLSGALAKSARRVAVPADIWLFLRNLWRQQRLREAQEEARGGAVVAGSKGGRGGQLAATRAGGGGGSAAAAVDCMDLTGDEPASARSGSGAQGKAAGVGYLDLAGGSDGGVDDDVMEVREVSVGQQSQPQPQSQTQCKPQSQTHGDSVAPSSREGSADADDPIALDEKTAAPAAAVPELPAPTVPSEVELDALCVELPVGRVYECPLCRAAAGQAAEAQADTRRQVEAERSALGGLATDVVPSLEPGGRYFMVPSGWIREWQQYVRGAARRAAGPPAVAAATAAGPPAGSSGAAAIVAARPGSLSAAMLRVLCPCHPDEPRLGVPAPRVVTKRNKLCQQDCDQEAMRLVQADEWQQLRRFYGISEPPALQAPTAAAAAAGVSTRAQRASRRARVEMHTEINDDDEVIKTSEQPGADGSAGGVDSACAEAAPIEPSAGVNAVRHGFLAKVVVVPAAVDGAGAGAASAAPVVEDLGPFRDRSQRDFVVELHVWPPVCAEALQEHHRMAREALLSYSDVEVMVELITHEELETAFREVVHAERKSKRSRKGRTAVVVSNTTTLHQLKLQVYENLSVHPRNQALYVRGDDGSPRTLEGDDLSLAQHEVLPGQEIRLVRLNMVDDDDDVTGLLGEGRGKRRQVEEGFKNTALHGDLPQQRPPGEGSAADGSVHHSDTVLSDTIQSDG